MKTTPGTQLIFGGTWCAGHAWRDKRGLWWVHHIGHRLRLLHNQPPARPLHYLEGK